ncbi:MAG TPA: glycosyltransferase [Candidatus Binatia bacterium]|nr:glycosyltransferase [Candidatus Binatia bacterium]
MTDVVFQQAAHEDADFVGFLEELGFRRIVLGKRRQRFGKKLALFSQVAASTIRLLSSRAVPKEMGTVVVLGHFAFAVKLLARLHLLKYERLFCSGFYVRSPRWFPFFRILRRIDTPRDHYLIFSRSELQLYTDQLGMDSGRLHYIPCGDWHSEETGKREAEDKARTQFPTDYYFSGGYSNRDYGSLVRVFRKVKAPLVIVCSKLNTEMNDLSLPPNVRVVRDVSSGVFDGYISHAKAGIVPLKRDTGSSGQTVVLRLMRYGKPIVVNDVAALRDYVEPGVSALVVRDLGSELAEAIQEIEAHPDAASRVGLAAKVRYEGSFSRAVVAERFRKILEETASSTAL